MKIQCAWCKKMLGEKAPFEDVSITHSICPECKELYFGKTKKNPIATEAVFGDTQRLLKAANDAYAMGELADVAYFLTLASTKFNELSQKIFSMLTPEQIATLKTQLS